MGEGSTAADRDTFARVWRRVEQAGGGAGPVEAKEELPPVDEEAFIRQRIREEFIDHRTCARLVCGGVSGQIMRGVAEDELSQARRLITARFLLTGERGIPARDCHALPFRDWPDGMRLMYHRAKAAEEAYRQAELDTQNPILRELYRACGEEERMHTLRIRTALERW